MVPQRVLKNAKRPFFRLKSHFTWRKSATKFLCGNTVNNEVVRHSLSYLSVQKGFAGNVLCYVKIWPKLAHRLNNADFRSIFAHTAAAVTPSDKSSVNMNRQFTMSFPVSRGWRVYVASKPLKGVGGQKCKVFKLWTIICGNFERVRDRISDSINYW